MKTLYYITFLDPVDRNFESKVIYKLDYLKSQGYKVQLISFFKLSALRASKKRLKEVCSHPFKVLAAIPGLNNWNKNTWMLKLLLPKNSWVVGKDVFACNLILKLNKNLNLIYDATYSIAAKEYDYQIYKKSGLSKQLKLLEKTAVRKSKFRWVNSESLVVYWQKHYDYQEDQHLVYPSDTLSYFKKGDMEQSRIEKRLANGFKPNDILIAYIPDFNFLDGQHFTNNVKDILKHKAHKLMYLGLKNNSIDLLASEFPDQIIIKEVENEEIAHWAYLADYSYQLYAKGTCNWIYNPITFSESLQMGLTPIINFNVCDIKKTYLTHSIGVKWEKNMILKPTSDADRKQMRFFAQHFLQFTPSTFKMDF